MDRRGAIVHQAEAFVKNPVTTDTPIRASIFRRDNRCDACHDGTVREVNLAAAVPHQGADAARDGNSRLVAVPWFTWSLG
jgi:hypothetical protein